MKHIFRKAVIIFDSKVIAFFFFFSPNGASYRKPKFYRLSKKKNEKKNPFITWEDQLGL